MSDCKRQNATLLGPSSAAPPAIGWWESATVRIEPTGSITVLTGSSPHGQGQETSFAQMVAEELGLQQWSISLSHTHTHAVAVVVALGET